MSRFNEFGDVLSSSSDESEANINQKAPSVDSRSFSDDSEVEFIVNDSPLMMNKPLFRVNASKSREIEPSFTIEDDSEYAEFLRFKSKSVETSVIALIGSHNSGKSSFLEMVTDAELDFFLDEKSREITMTNKIVTGSFEGESRLVQFIDTPGHPNFSNFVDDAVSLCDQVLFFVDVGVGLDEWNEKLLHFIVKEHAKPVSLVLSKFDRLISEFRYPPEDLMIVLKSRISEINLSLQKISPNYFQLSKNIIFNSNKWNFNFTLSSVARTIYASPSLIPSLDFMSNNEPVYYENGQLTRSPSSMVDAPHAFVALILLPIYKLVGIALTTEQPKKLASILKSLKIKKSEIRQANKLNDLLKLVMTKYFHENPMDCVIDVTKRHKNIPGNSALIVKGCRVGEFYARNSQHENCLLPIGQHSISCEGNTVNAVVLVKSDNLEISPIEKTLNIPILLGVRAIKPDGEEIEIEGIGELSLDQSIRDKCFNEDMEISDVYVKLGETVTEISSSIISIAIDRDVTIQVYCEPVSISLVSDPRIFCECNTNILYNDLLIKDFQKIDEYKDILIQAFVSLVTNNGPIVNEPVFNTQFSIMGVSGMTSVTSSTDILANILEGFSKALLCGGPCLMQPIVKMVTNTISPCISMIINLIEKRDGIIIKEKRIEGSEEISIVSLIPMIEYLGLETQLRAATNGISKSVAFFEKYEIIEGDWRIEYEIPLLTKIDGPGKARDFYVKTKRRKNIR
jgi:translation elongation factor EF-G